MLNITNNGNGCGDMNVKIGSDTLESCVTYEPIWALNGMQSCPFLYTLIG